MRGSTLATRKQVSPNIEPRPVGKTISLIVLHYTGMPNGDAAVAWLCNASSKVSCHYLVDIDGSITQMVDEKDRAWHAGVSSWFGEIDINSISLGIEVQNAGHAGGSPAFPQVQMQAVEELVRDIMCRHGLAPHQVVAHSDVAPGRKIDPGEAFDWDFLAARGIGQTLVAHGGVELPTANMQRLLQRLGYNVDVTGHLDDKTRIVVSAFQRRYRRSRVNGEADAETRAILQRLVNLMPDDISRIA